MRLVLLIGLLASCASDRTRLENSALVEVNTYAQRETTRWVITEVRIRGVRDVEGTFEIPSGPQRLEVDWSRYDATENFNAGVYFWPIGDRPKEVDSGTREIDFTPVAGKLYRLQWTTPAASPDMVLTLVEAGQRPAETG